MFPNLFPRNFLKYIFSCWKTPNLDLGSSRIEKKLGMWFQRFLKFFSGRWCNLTSIYILEGMVQTPTAKPPTCTTNQLHPRKLAAGYQKWWFGKCISFRVWPFWISMLDFWGVLLKTSNISFTCSSSFGRNRMCHKEILLENFHSNTPGKFDSSILKSYKIPIGKDRRNQPPPFCRGELLNFRGVSQPTSY